MIKDKSNRILSEVTAFRTYAKYLQHLNRRETLNETINRVMFMHLEKFPELSKDIIKAFQQVHELKVMPSMRSLQFGGEAIKQNNLRLFNCSAVIPNYVRVFAEIAFVLLAGTGVGSSVQRKHIDKLPPIRRPKEEGEYIIHDSIEGWAEAFEKLSNAYFYGGIRPIFNYTRIREKGSVLHTTGAKAPGPEPLRHALELLEDLFKKATGRKLTSIEVFDAICIISDCVVAGGVRRAALIILFDHDDESMLTSKHGNWWEKSPHRARANISAVLHRKECTQEDFNRVYDACIASNCGEPGFFFTNDFNYLTNPCCEIALRCGVDPDYELKDLVGEGMGGLCNLTTINLTGIKDKKDLHNRVYAAALIGTLQASYTDFPFLNHKWKLNAEDESLLGVSMTGVCDNPEISEKDLEEMAELVREVNIKYAKKIGIKPAKRLTCNKPEGTASAVLGSSSGVHERHDEFYFRRIRIGMDDQLCPYLMKVVPDLMAIDPYTRNTMVLTLPQKSPEGSITRHQSDAKTMLKRVLKYNKHWVKPGHNEGANRHNVSCTINYKPEEVDLLKFELWKNREHYSGISLLPFSDHIYELAPFESCTKEQYEEMMKKVVDIDLTKVLEFEDNTSRQEQVACGGSGQCELDFVKSKE